jgi:two-component system nitrogen regulation response regulator GlnG
VRELRSVIRESLINATGPVIVPSFLPKILTDTESVPATTTGGTNGPESDLPPSDLGPFIARRIAAGSTDLYAEAVEALEKYLITRALQHTEGNQTKAAELLGITRGKIRDRVKSFGINLDKSITLEN